MVTLQEIEDKYLEITNRIGRDEQSMPYGTIPDDSGREHIEISPDGKIALVSTERGTETKRRETKSLDELLYWIFSGWANAMGWAYEVKHRHPKNDSRRIAFRKALEAMCTISEEWRDRLAKEHEQILIDYPFKDNRD